MSVHAAADHVHAELSGALLAAVPRDTIIIVLTRCSGVREPLLACHAVEAAIRVASAAAIDAIHAPLTAHARVQGDGLGKRLGTLAAQIRTAHHIAIRFAVEVVARRETRITCGSYDARVARPAIAPITVGRLARAVVITTAQKQRCERREYNAGSDRDACRHRLSQ
jgi:hypothetical protein